MSSERTRLSGTAVDLVGSITRLGPAFAPLVPLYVPTIIRLLGKANKVYVARAQNALTAIARNTRLASVIPQLASFSEDKSNTIRGGCVECLYLLLCGGDNGAPLADKHALERWLSELEKMIRKGATDREVRVRELCKKIWECYRKLWPERIDGYVYCIVFSPWSLLDDLRSSDLDLHPRSLRPRVAISMSRWVRLRFMTRSRPDQHKTTRAQSR
jgi:hypothetical protein